MRVPVRGKNIYSKYLIDVVNLISFKIKYRGLKLSEKGPYHILECLNISNLVNTKVAKFIKYQPRGGGGGGGGWSNHLSVESIKIEKEKC